MIHFQGSLNAQKNPMPKAAYQERPAQHAARPLSGPNAHPYLWMLERLTAGTLTLDQIPPQDMAIVEYAIRSRAEQAKNRHKRGGSKGGAMRSAAKGSRPTNLDLLRRLRTAAHTLGRTPRQVEFPTVGLPALSTWQRHFGSYVLACQAAGLVPNHGRQKRGVA